MICTIAAKTGAGFILKQGQRLKVVDPEGGQVSDLFCFAENNANEWLSSGRSIDYNDQIYLSSGHQLWSNRSRPMLSILADSCGTHDFLLTPCSLEMFQLTSGSQAYHPSCLENLATALSPHGIQEDQIGTSFNIFMNVPVDAKGKFKILAPRSAPGASIVFRAEMNLWVGLTACSHEGSNGGSCKPIEFEILDSEHESS